MTTAFIMACLPVDVSDLPDIGMELPKPTNLYSLIQCENPDCARDMWIGPRQLLRAGEMVLLDCCVFKLCYLCVVRSQALLGELPVDSLGGGAGVEGVVRR